MYFILNWCIFQFDTYYIYIQLRLNLQVALTLVSRLSWEN